LATTSKELIEILQKYTKPDDVVIWNYFTRDDFDYDDQPAPTNEQFAEIADELDKWDIWEGISDKIADAIWDTEIQKGKE
jgi:hypothetical protein